jgi:AcrR family transcriptional regulator
MTEPGDDSAFNPLLPYYGHRPVEPRAAERDRRLAGQVDRRREHGGRPAPRARGLTRGDIVAAAVAIADAEGTEAVSIRRIARDLRVGAMSLYWYVASTAELHQMMIEQVQAETEVPEPSGHWRRDLRRYAFSARAALLRHPWAIDFLGAGPPTGPQDARNVDRLIGAFDGTSADIRTTMWAVMTLATYVMGAALREVQEIRWHRAAAEAEAACGMTEEEMAAAREEFARRVLGSGQFPHIAKIFDADFDPDAPEARDERFEFGLGIVLDGIAARLTAATSGNEP